eukprot:Rmarinus@m.3241
MPKPLTRHTGVKKRSNPFKRHQSDRFMRVPESWRRPKGIDSCVRRQFRGTIPMPGVGYGSEKRTRHILPCGFKKFRVFNAKELDMLLMQNRKYAAEIAAGVSARKRKNIIKRAKTMDIKVLNASARLRTEEKE